MVSNSIRRRNNKVRALVSPVVLLYPYRKLRSLGSPLHLALPPPYGLLSPLKAVGPGRRPHLRTRPEASFLVLLLSRPPLLPPLELYLHRFLRHLPSTSGLPHRRIFLMVTRQRSPRPSIPICQHLPHRPSHLMPLMLQHFKCHLL